MAASNAAEITARIDRLPSCREFWRLIVLLSLGGAFEMYDLFQTAYLSPGLISSGIFHAGEKGLFGLTDQASFAAATFAGLFFETMVFGSVADRFGRRTIFTLSLLWYTAASLAMGIQHSNVGVDLWRFIAGLGIGVELVTIDAYISELAPKRLRGRSPSISPSSFWPSRSSLRFHGSWSLALLWGWMDGAGWFFWGPSAQSRSG